MPDLIPSNLLLWPFQIAPSTTTLALNLPGEPATKQRIRIAKSGRAYTPDGTRQAQEWIGWHVKNAIGSVAPNADSLYGIRAQFNCATYQRRDLDNMLKLITDACTGLVWVDDSQVVEVTARVRRGCDNPSTEFAIYQVEGSPIRQITCAVCGRSTRTYPAYKGKQYCSQACAMTARRTGSIKTCANCHAPVYRNAAQLTGSRGRFFCSLSCKTAATTIVLVCIQCTRTYRRPKSQTHSGNPYCSIECKAAYWKVKRAQNALASCSKCGGPKSDKRKQLCMGCYLSSVPSRKS